MLMSFWIMVFLLFLGWKADVAAFLTSNKVVYAINSFEELASSGTYNPLVIHGSGVLGFLRVIMFLHISHNSLCTDHVPSEQ